MAELLWGTFGKGGVEHCGGECPRHKLRWIELKSAETEHLQAILRTQNHIYHHDGYIKTIYAVLKERGVTPETYSFEADSALRWAAFTARKAYFKLIGEQHG